MQLTGNEYAALAANGINQFAAAVDFGNPSKLLFRLLLAEKCQDQDSDPSSTHAIAAWNAFIDAAMAYVEASTTKVKVTKL